LSLRLDLLTHFPESELFASRILRNIDDNDVFHCHEEGYGRSGWFILLVIGIPTILAIQGLDDFYIKVLFQSICSGFIVGNIYLLEVSPAALVSPYAAVILFLLWRYLIMKPSLKRRRERLSGQEEKTSAADAPGRGWYQQVGRRVTSWTSAFLDLIGYVNSILSLHILVEKIDADRAIQAQWTDLNRPEIKPSLAPVVAVTSTTAEGDVVGVSIPAAVQAMKHKSMPLHYPSIITAKLSNAFGKVLKIDDDHAEEIAMEVIYENYLGIPSCPPDMDAVDDNPLAMTISKRKKQQTIKLTTINLTTIYRNNHITIVVDEALRRIIMLLMSQPIIHLSSSEPSLSANPISQATSLPTSQPLPSLTKSKVMGRTSHLNLADIFSSCKLSYLESSQMVDSYNGYHLIHEYCLALDCIWQCFYPMDQAMTVDEEAEIMSLFIEYVTIDLCNVEGIYFQDFNQWFRKSMVILCKLRVHDTSVLMFEGDDPNYIQEKSQRLQERILASSIREIIQIASEEGVPDSEDSSLDLQTADRPQVPYSYSSSSAVMMDKPARIRKNRKSSSQPSFHTLRKRMAAFATSQLNRLRSSSPSPATMRSSDEEEESLVRTYFSIHNEVRRIINFLDDRQQLSTSSGKREDALLFEDVLVVYNIYTSGLPKMSALERRDLDQLFNSWTRSLVSQLLV
jgi:hypothetical protein